MRQRDFGSTGMTVSEIGVGCSRIGGALTSGSSRRDEITMLQEAADAGISFFDTADMYAQGQSEVILGRALRSRRSEVVIATKGGYVVPPSGRLLARLKPVARPVLQRLGVRRRPSGAHGPRTIPQDFSPGHLRAAVEASLRRLGTDYIDVYQLHSPSRAVIDAADYLGVLEELRGQGKILHCGVAADDPDDVSAFHRLGGLASLQVPFNLVDQRAADDLFPQAAARGVGIISRSCYVAGLLRDDVPEATLRSVTPDWQEILRIRQVAGRIGRPVLEAALQLSLSIPTISVTILGMRTPEHLRENLRLHAAPPLTAADIAQLSRPAKARGATADDHR
jgi:aryl-alcohol dehydrogenase-like predicted oxidoreductase